MHLHRVTRDIQADASRHAVRFPDRPTAGLPSLDEAIIVAAVAGALAPAKARHIVQDFRVASGKRIHCADDIGRPRRRVRAGREGRQLSRVTRRHWCKRAAAGPLAFQGLRWWIERPLLSRGRTLVGRSVAAASGTRQRANSDDDERPPAPTRKLHPQSLTPARRAADELPPVQVGQETRSPVI